MPQCQECHGRLYVPGPFGARIARKFSLLLSAGVFRTLLGLKVVVYVGMFLYGDRHFLALLLRANHNHVELRRVFPFLRPTVYCRTPVSTLRIYTVSTSLSLVYSSTTSGSAPHQLTSPLPSQNPTIFPGHDTTPPKYRTVSTVLSQLRNFNTYNNEHSIHNSENFYLRCVCVYVNEKDNFFD